MAMETCIAEQACVTRKCGWIAADHHDARKFGPRQFGCLRSSAAAWRINNSSIIRCQLISQQRLSVKVTVGDSYLMVASARPSRPAGCC
jgi:hypothetical protein